MIGLSAQRGTNANIFENSEVFCCCRVLDPNNKKNSATRLFSETTTMRKTVDVSKRFRLLLQHHPYTRFLSVICKTSVYFPTEEVVVEPKKKKPPHTPASKSAIEIVHVGGGDKSLKFHHRSNQLLLP